MQGQQEESHWAFVHLSLQSYQFPASHFPPGFFTSPEPFFSPCDTDYTEQPCSAICRKLEVTQQNSGRKEGKRLSGKRQLPGTGMISIFQFEYTLVFQSLLSGYLTYTGKYSCKKRISILLFINSTSAILRAQAEGQLTCLAANDV